MLSVAAILVTLLGYVIAYRLSQRFRKLQPIVVGTVLVWLIWWLVSGDWTAYAAGGDWISVWLGPATVALAVPLTKQLQQLKRIWKGALLGIVAGTGMSLASTWLFFWLLGGDQALFTSLLTKSVTTPISVELTASIGGMPALAAFFTALTGVLGSLMARPLLKAAGITDDWAIGLAVGTSAHAIGTASLHRDSELQAAASTLAMIVAGVITSLYLIPFSLASSSP